MNGIFAFFFSSPYVVRVSPHSEALHTPTIECCVAATAKLLRISAAIASVLTALSLTLIIIIKLAPLPLFC